MGSRLFLLELLSAHEPAVERRLAAGFAQGGAHKAGLETGAPEGRFMGSGVTWKEGLTAKQHFLVGAWDRRQMDGRREARRAMSLQLLCLLAAPLFVARASV